MAKLITMTPKELSRYEIIKRLIGKEINGTEAAKQTGLSVRQVKNLKARVKQYGAQGIIHGHRGKSSNRKMSDGKIGKIKRIVRDSYCDFGPTFASEKLEENHQIKVGKEKLRLLMTGWRFWKPKPRKKNKEYRSWRPRKEYYGEMEQFDGCYYDWLEARAERCCLLASIDDATGKITGANLVHDEGVKPVYGFWKNYVQSHGKPLKIYLDRLSTYKNTHKSVFDDPAVLTQFQRAMKDLDIEDISAYSPQAKGRIERLWPTLQDRLVKELRLAKISTIEEANRFLEEVFISKFNAKFSVVAQKKRNLHRALTEIDKRNLDKIFSEQNTRIVNNDFTLRINGKWYQLAEQQPTLVLRKDKVLVEERIDGSRFVSLRDKYLNYTVLPARPEKVKMKVIALARTKSSWKPPANHPWRQPFISSPEKRYKVSSRV
jgi:hypothetical protein